MKKLLVFLGIFAIFSGFLFCYELTLASKLESIYLAKNWLIYINKIPLKDKLGEYQIRFIEQVNHNGYLLCEIYHLYPRGHILVPSYKEFPPIKSFSVVSNFNSKSEGYEYAVLEELKAAFKFLQSYSPGESKEVEKAIKSNSHQWNKFIRISFEKDRLEELELIPEKGKMNTRNFFLIDKFGMKLETVSAPPLLETKWGQSSPYNNWCPLLWGDRCVVGCTATAMAQIMRYYRWPKEGEGYHSYYWSNGYRWLSAYFSDSYDWDYMPNETWQYNTSREQDAVAELCYEVGVSMEMGYGTDGSSVSTYKVDDALETYFKYSDEAKTVDREDYNNVDEWFEVLRGQRDLSRPLQFRMCSSDDCHAVVIDGYLITSGLKQVHINMGWRGNSDAYYTLDNILDFTEIGQYAVIDIVPAWAEIQLNKTSLSFSGEEGQSNPPSQTFKMRNSGEGELNYQISANKNWLSVYPESGRSTGEWDTITISTDISSLLDGTYTGIIEITSENAANSPQQLTVNLTIKPPPIYPPLHFSGTKVENKSFTQIEYINVLTWESHPLNKHIEKYRIYQVEGQNHSLLVELNADTLEYWHRKVGKDKIYVYTLRAVDYKNREGEPAYLEIK